MSGLFTDADFEDWFPADGRPGMPAARMALVSVLQFAGDLSDRQAAVAVRCRIVWGPELVTEALRAAAEALAAASESWLARAIDAEWGQRYGLS